MASGRNAYFGATQRLYFVIRMSSFQIDLEFYGAVRRIISATFVKSCLAGLIDFRGIPTFSLTDSASHRLYFLRGGSEKALTALCRARCPSTLNERQ